jgi:cytochrome P450
MMSTYLISDPEFARQVFTAKDVFDGRSDEPPLRHIVPTGLLALKDGERWRVHRRIMTAPLHNKEFIQQYMVTINQTIDIFLWNLERKVASGPAEMDVVQPLKMLTLDAIMRLAFGYTGDLQSEHSSLQSGIFRNHDKILVTGALFQNLIPRYIWRLTPMREKFDAAIRRFHDLVDQVLMQGKASKGSIIDALKSGSDPESAAKLTAQELKDESLTILLAGHETTTNTLGWALYLLSRPENNLELQSLQEEIEKVLGGRDQLTIEDYDKLEFAQATIFETLRLFPTVPFVSRYCRKSFKLGEFEILPKVSWLKSNLA